MSVRLYAVKELLSSFLLAVSNMPTWQLHIIYMSMKYKSVLPTDNIRFPRSVIKRFLHEKNVTSEASDKTLKDVILDF